MKDLTTIPVVGVLFSKYESLVITFFKVFVFSFIGTILAVWIGGTVINVSGLWGAIQHTWDSAAGVALLSALTAVGFKVPVAIKTKSV